ncbi:hypothetical protein [Nonomuraea recticatena]|uniref:Uncharacterized protein n=1 Tax=Nonomuraea recticatena TaxID=46178 RepID=A0ABP6E2Z3_9ACTN
MAALLTAVSPTVYFWIDDGGGGSFTWGSAGRCLGNELSDQLWFMSGLPLFWYGGAPLIVLGFLGWYLAVRAGRERLARALARAAVGALLLCDVSHFLLLILDAAIGAECLDAWGPPEAMSLSVRTGLLSLAPPLLILLAVRRPFVRRGRFLRATFAALTMMALLLVPTTSAFPGRMSTESELDCDGSGDGTAKGFSKAEKDFLCRVHGHTVFHGEGEALAVASDQVLLERGYRLCKMAEHDIEGALRSEYARALGSLCPVVAQAQENEGRRRQEEQRAFFAKGEKACAAHPAHRPRAKPVRLARATMWTESWTINGWDEGFEGTIPDLAEELVGSERGALAIWAADESGHACVTGESYAKPPPLETKGWDEVVEVGYESPSGSLVIVDNQATALPDLTPGGPGFYRVRVHLRGRELVYQVPDPPDGAVELLVMVFPGKETEPIVYK